MDDESQTSADLSDDLSKDGYEGQFMPAGGSRVRCLSCDNEFAAGEVTTASLGRAEGMSDPDDETAVIAIECPQCSTKGTMVLKYGPTASVEESDILAAIRT